MSAPVSSITEKSIERFNQKIQIKMGIDNILVAVFKKLKWFLPCFSCVSLLWRTHTLILINVFVNIITICLCFVIEFRLNPLGMRHEFNKRMSFYLLFSIGSWVILTYYHITIDSAATILLLCTNLYIGLLFCSVDIPHGQLLIDRVFYFLLIRLKRFVGPK